MTVTETNLRTVLSAPRGHRFSRPHLAETFQERERRLLRQMVGNPRVARRIEHGQLPHWMIVARERREKAQTQARAEVEAARAEVDDVLPPALPRSRHRALRKQHGRTLLAYGMTLVAGAVPPNSSACCYRWADPLARPRTPVRVHPLDGMLVQVVLNRISWDIIWRWSYDRHLDS